MDSQGYTSSKKQPAMLYTMVSHKADKYQNVLFSILKNSLRAYGRISLWEYA
jgi:hypothetical protein